MAKTKAAKSKTKSKPKAFKAKKKQRRMKNAPNELLLAVDCLQPQEGKLASAFHSADSFAKSLGWKQSAVAVVSPDQLGWPQDFDRTWRDEFAKLGADALTRFLTTNKVAGRFPARVLMHPYRSSRESVRTIIAEAKRKQVSAIAVFTHLKKPGHLSMPGSFVSSLIYHSPMPVLALNALASATLTIKTIMLATDFSRESTRAFQRAIAMARAFSAQLVLVHVLPTLANQTMAASASMAGGWQNAEAYLQASEASIKTKAEACVAEAQRSGVEASYHLISNALFTSEALIDAIASYKIDLVVLTEKTGPWESIVLGSVTRDLLANISQPVFVVPARANRAATSPHERRGLYSVDVSL